MLSFSLILGGVRMANYSRRWKSAHSQNRKRAIGRFGCGEDFVPTQPFVEEQEGYHDDERD